ncbi:MAG: helix-turn-helix transcriptional regulator [Pseudomonadota bacterium]
MILKHLRISRHLSQEQLAVMSGLNVRTIQRIESGKNASVESLKSLAAALEVDIETLKQEEFVISRSSDNWQALPLWLKCWFYFNLIFGARTPRGVVTRLHWICHLTGFGFCAFGWFSEPALAGGLIMLACAHLFALLTWQGDRYGIWFDPA